MTARDWAHPPMWLGVLLQLAAAALLFQEGLPLARHMVQDPRSAGVFDFYQEWGAARNWREGMPIYTPLQESLRRHLGLRYVSLVIRHNAHPPVVALLSLPLGYLEYVPALLLWNAFNVLLVALSVAMTLRALKWNLSGWWVLPLGAAIVFFNPFYQQCIQGQLGGVLLFLVTAAWVAERRGAGGWAGVALGLATAIKLFPGFLVIGLLLRRQWVGVAAAVLIFIFLNLAAWGLLGSATFHDYVTIVLPDLQRFRAHMTNASILGFGHKLFIGNPAEEATPLWPNARVGWIVMGLLLAGVASVALFWAWRARTGTAFDLTIGINVSAMLLLSPLTWDHSLLLVLPWIIVAAGSAPWRIIPWCCLALLLLGMSTNHVRLWHAGHPSDVTRVAALVGAGALEAVRLPATGATPAVIGLVNGWTLTPTLPAHTFGHEVLGRKGLPFYTLLGWMLFQCWLARQAASQAGREA